MWVRKRSWFRFLPGSLVLVVGQLVRDDLWSVQPPEPEPLRLIHTGLGRLTQLGSARLGSGPGTARCIEV